MKVVEKQKTVLDALRENYPENSKSSLLKWFYHGRIALNGKTLKKPHFPYPEGGELSLLKKEEHKLPFPIVYEDDHLLVLNKPHNLLSVPGADLSEKNVFSMLKEHYGSGKIYPVHRLDKEVSGLLMFAKSQKAFLRLKEEFSEHLIEREYLALVKGNLPEEKGTWKSYLKEGKDYKVRSSTHEGKEAVSHYEVIDKDAKVSFLWLTLETGRKNQLRVHARDAGHPILGDAKYGGFSSSGKPIALHAYLLRFTHPVTGEEIRLKGTLSSYFQKVLGKNGFRLPKHQKLSEKEHE